MVFDLGNKVQSNTRIRILEKGRNFAPIQNKINELKLRRNFQEFCGGMCLKWYFRNDPTP